MERMSGPAGVEDQEKNKRNIIRVCLGKKDKWTARQPGRQTGREAADTQTHR